MLQIDAREPKTIIAATQKEAKKRGIETEVKLLECGDFVWVDTGICIERKAHQDFANSIREGRIVHQLLRMQGYPNPYLFISGALEDIIIYGKAKPWLWTVSAHDKAKMTVSAKYNVKVLQFANDMKLIDAIFRLKETYDEFNETGVGHAIIKQIRKSDVIDPNYVMYMSIPGVGKKSALKMVGNYPKFYDFMSVYTAGEVKLSKAGIEFIDKLI